MTPPESSSAPRNTVIPARARRANPESSAALRSREAAWIPGSREERAPRNDRVNVGPTKDSCGLADVIIRRCSPSLDLAAQQLQFEPPLLGGGQLRLGGRERRRGLVEPGAVAHIKLGIGELVLQ